MGHFGRREKTFALLVCTLIVIWGCAAPSIAPKSPQVANRPMAPEGQASQSPVGAAGSAAAERVQNIEIQEGTKEVVVILSGNAPFSDYQFRRLDDGRFALDLGDIKTLGDLPAAPPASARLSLDYSTMDSGSGVQLLGTLKERLETYVLNMADNKLVLALYLSGEPTAPPSSMSAREPVAPPAVAGKKAKLSQPAPRTAGQAKKSHVKQTATAAAVREPMHPDEGLPRPSKSEAIAVVQGAQAKQYVGKPISLDLMDADLRNVLRLISDVTGTNIVIEPDVAGKVTLKVEQVPWDQVLDMVLAMNSLGKEQNNNVIRVARMEKLRHETSLRVDEIRAKQDLMTAAQDLGEISTAYLRVNYAQPADIGTKLTTMMSDKGKVSVDEKTRLIIYTDYTTRIDNARTLVSKLDKATAQVLIEARIVTMNANLARDIGTNFGLTISHRTTPLAPQQTWNINSPSAAFFDFSMAQVFGKTLVQLDLLLSAFESTSEINIVAAPKVVTLDNVKATIVQGTQIPYREINETGTVTSTKFKDATVELNVVPHITPDGKVRMEIQAKEDEPTAETFGQDQQVGIDTRRITTELMVDDGNIVVIGGVQRNRDTMSETATPGLARVPILGALFKHDKMTTEKTELLIFISPKIVEASRVM